MEKFWSMRAGLLPMRFFALVGLLCLSGCLVGPDYQKPLFFMPNTWKSNGQEVTSQSVSLGGWWHTLHDPLLDQLVQAAIYGNNDVASAKAKVREARASLWQTSGTLFPTLDGTASANRNKAAGGSENSQFRGGLDSRWEIDLFGANRRAIEAAKYGLDGAYEEMRATMVTLIGDVATNYVEARGLQHQIALAKNTAQAQKRTAQLTKDKFSAGAVSQLDVSNAQGQSASTEAGIPQMEANLAVTIHRLSVLTGQNPTALFDLMKKTGKIPQPKWPIPAGIPADILLTRPDVGLAERRYAQSTARLGQREAERYPALTLTGNIATSGTQIGQLGKNSTISWSFGPGLSVPIFNGGQLAAAVDIARAQRDQSFIAYRKSILLALEEVENAIVSMQKQRQRSVKLAQSSSAYAKALDLSRSLYEGGNTSFLELLNAERSHYSSQQSLIESRVSITTQYIALMKALGGGWDGVVETSKPEIVDGYTGPHLKTAYKGGQ
ncbi:efflux transporter outer membrane subunit [Bartonella tamiae]|uniref:NodT family efflux transporter, outer membrane factor (OMF) lipoprotein n=1 Tax=Bartonella tamiae Th239 TaxID=1094558 RepID=J0ZS12_9HYPH|nr:efflux transporter outer membrane subunit [Bartonella tamiae]EJF91503.1 NodT family efflux transporter, outer membrane factor (OMF) lipoprotein [Bartonella tamiae Th239]EJF92513.1 NodT family efflux transporter, outer membrane factor (OMF) lipoprotein [Bartonella tamiae Th307]